MLVLQTLLFQLQDVSFGLIKLINQFSVLFVLLRFFLDLRISLLTAA